MSKSVIFIILIFFANISKGQEDTLTNISRKSAVLIRCYHNSNHFGSGSGFFVNFQGATFIITNLHVITSSQTFVSNNQKIINYTLLDSIIATTYDNKSFRVFFQTNDPNTISQECMTNDFAILYSPSYPKNIHKLSMDTTNEFFVGQQVIFSGYPLECPLLTHYGTISGKDSAQWDRIYVQSSINNGNSGGALLNKKGKVIGIISMKKTPDLTPKIDQLNEIIKMTGGITFGSISYSDNSVIKAGGTQYDKEVLELLNTYLNTGIGIAINIKYAVRYIGLKKKVKK